MAAVPRPRVVIVGAGFGGLWAAKVLRKAPVDVVLVDRHNFHTFFPLLYQVAAAELAPGDIAHPVRKIIRRQRNIRFLLAEVTGLDKAAGLLATSTGPLAYDYLVLSPGSATQYFGVPGAEEHCFALRTLEHAVDLRNHILREFESADNYAGAEPDEIAFVIVGGGPTGVEFAGALQELINGPLSKDHPRLVGSRVRVLLVERSDRLLEPYPQRLSEYAAARLQRMGVDVVLGNGVAVVDAAGVTLHSGERVDTKTVVWTAGVGGPPSLRDWGLAVGNAARASVAPDLSVLGASNIFVVGDASVPQGVVAPMVAQNATQQGTLAAHNVLARISGTPTKTFRYRDLGNMAVIGRNAAVVHLFGRVSLKGYPAWLLWLGLHLAKLVGFRNRVAALLSWSGDYIFRDRVARLVVSEIGDKPA